MLLLFFSSRLVFSPFLSEIHFLVWRSGSTTSAICVCVCSLKAGRFAICTSLHHSFASFYAAINWISQSGGWCLLFKFLFGKHRTYRVMVKSVNGKHFSAACSLLIFVWHSLERWKWRRRKKWSSVYGLRASCIKNKRSILLNKKIFYGEGEKTSINYNKRRWDGYLTFVR